MTFNGAMQWQFDDEPTDEVVQEIVRWLRSPAGEGSGCCVKPPYLVEPPVATVTDLIRRVLDAMAKGKATRATARDIFSHFPENARTVVERVLDVMLSDEENLRESAQSADETQ